MPIFLYVFVLVLSNLLPSEQFTNSHRQEMDYKKLSHVQNFRKEIYLWQDTQDQLIKNLVD